LKEIADVLSEADQVARENKKKPLKIYDTQELTELRWLNQKHGQIKLTLAFMSSSKAVWASPTDSLIQVACTFLIWNIGHNSTPIRKCKASERATGRMRVCNNYFWADDPKHRSEYCSTRCKNMVAAEKLQERKRKKREVSKNGGQS
ncbi:MAG: hypothetical protein K6U04_05645, partial [Armatimonadetes bacterium]|nr:hypothetical protein [Armatimonadota bacterium]